jgi:hypothetical protein
MDWQFWIGLALGIPLSIFANLYTDRVRDYLDKRRTIRLSRKKSKEVRTYLYVRSLMEGHPGSKVLLDMDNSLVDRLTTMWAFIYLLAAIAILFAFQPKFEVIQKPILIGAMAVLLLSTVLSIPLLIIHLDLTQTRRKVRRFSDYENSIREKWGDDAIEEFLAPQDTHLPK